MPADPLDTALFTLTLVTNYLVCAVFAAWYVWPTVRVRPKTEALAALLWPQTLRFVNLWSASHQLDPHVPHAFAIQVASGDFVAAILALIALVALRRVGPAAIPLALLANTWGIVDFLLADVVAVVDDVVSNPMAMLWFIAAIAVPPLCVCHVLSFARLRGSD